MNVDKNNGESFEKVYSENFSLLIRVAYHITGDMSVSEDLCQEAFLRYYNRGGLLPDMQQTRFWLIRVVKNLCYNHEKRRFRERKAYDRVLNDPGKKQSEVSAEVPLLKSENLKIIQGALEKLPYKLKTVLVLKEYGNLNYKEIARILKTTEGNIKVRVHRARTLLQKMIDEEGVHVS